jgi:uncharacterized protein (TIGR01244 family)
MNLRRINDRFAVGGQISAEDVRQLADAGFRGVICARPDNEDPGQPRFAEIAAMAEKVGMTAVHIPVSGQLTEGQLIRFEAALAEIEGPVLGYCRSGGRAGSLYMALQNRR